MPYKPAVSGFILIGDEIFAVYKVVPADKGSGGTHRLIVFVNKVAPHDPRFFFIISGL